MTLDESTDAELWKLMETLCERGLDGAQANRLEQLVMASPEARAFYVDYMHLHAGLARLSPTEAELLARLESMLPSNKIPSAPRQDVTNPEMPARTPPAPVADEGPQAAPFSNPSSFTLPRWLVPREVWLDAAPAVMAGLLVLAIGACLGYYWASRDEDSRIAESRAAQPAAGQLADESVAQASPEAPRPHDTPQQPSPSPASLSLATLVSGDPCRLLGTNRLLRLGDRIEPGDRLEFTGAWSELLFDDGARLAIQAPATLEIIATGRVKFHAGCLLAQVPPQARGFTVDVGNWDVVDIGTEFGLTIDDEGAIEVHVLAGTVELVPTALGEPRGDSSELRLQTGDARRLVSPRADAWSPIEFSTDRFALLLKRNAEDTAARREPAAGSEGDRPSQGLYWTNRLHDGFDGAALDPRRWFVVKPVPSARTQPGAARAGAKLASGRLVLDNGCLVGTADQFDPAAGAIRVRVVWQVNTVGDSPGLVLRAAKPSSAAGLGKNFARSGVHAYIDVDGAGQGPRLVLSTQNGGPGGNQFVQSQASIDLPLPGETHEYDIVDSGQAVTLIARRLAGPHGAREVMVSIDLVSSAPRHHILLHNAVEEVVDSGGDRLESVSITSFTIKTPTLESIQTFEFIKKLLNRESIRKLLDRDGIRPAE